MHIDSETFSFTVNECNCISRPQWIHYIIEQIEEWFFEDHLAIILAVDQMELMQAVSGENSGRESPYHSVAREQAKLKPGDNAGDSIR